MTSRSADPPKAATAPLTFRDLVRGTDPDTVRTLVAGTEFFNPAEVDIAVELVRERLDKGAASGYEFVFAETGGAPAGYACYGSIDGTESSYDLYWIAVAADARGRGLGRALLAECEARIHRASGRRVYVETASRAQYAPTRAFYEHAGYRQEAMLADFYAPGDGKVIYVKVLDH
jgi:ribosomal protein S18 acetylase RimI-like enzyme